MAKKSLFNDSDQWTPESQELANDARKAIFSVIQESVKSGYSPREIEYIVNQEVSSICLSMLIK